MESLESQEERNRKFKQEYRDLYTLLRSVQMSSLDALENSNVLNLALAEGYCNQNKSGNYELTDKGRELIWVYGST